MVFATNNTWEEFDNTGIMKTIHEVEIGPILEVWEEKLSFAKRKMKLRMVSWEYYTLLIIRMRGELLKNSDKIEKKID